MSKPPTSSVESTPPKTWTFLVDECCDQDLVEALKERRHTVHNIGDELPSGTPDKAIAVRAQNLRAIIVTENRKDFEKLCGKLHSRRAPGEGHHVPGCVYVDQMQRRGPRIRLLLPLIEKLIDDAERYSDARIFIEIQASKVIVQR